LEALEALEAQQRGRSLGGKNQSRKDKQRAGKLGGKAGSREDKQRAGHRGAAVLRAKPAAERAAMFQKGWATRRAKAAAAQLAELEPDSKPSGCLAISCAKEEVRFVGTKW
jgi:hypothetical protein